MIRQEIKLHKNYQIKSFKEYHNGILTIQELYNRKGLPIKTHIKNNKHFVYKNGILKKTIKFHDNNRIEIKYIEEEKYNYHHITEFYSDGTSIRRKAKFKYIERIIHGVDNTIEYQTSKHILEGTDLHYTFDGEMITQKEIYKNGKLYSRLFLEYHKGEYIKLIYGDSTPHIRHRINKPITPYMLNKFAPNWNECFKHFYVGQPCGFLSSGEQLSGGYGIISDVISWYQVEVTDELGRKFIVPKVYTYTNNNTNP